MPSGKSKTYRVQKGETLWDIADRSKAEDVKTKDAVIELFSRNWQPLARKFHLEEGTVLKMPEDFDDFQPSQM